jgi:hypothetical protein
MLMRNKSLRIVTEKEDLREGLFGQVFVHTFEILPYLYGRGIFPGWKIRAKHYGRTSDGTVIPGVLDLAYDVAPGPKKQVNLVSFREHHRHAIGNDWRALQAIWNSYFRIPNRIVERADALGSLADVLGIHFRGNDKQTAAWDTNPVSHEEYLSIIKDFISTRPEFNRVFLATDDFSFYDFLKNKIAVEVINLGHVGFHKAEQISEVVDDKMDRAVLDCLLLSRCGAVLQTSSALSSFAKILNPALEIYRVGASKAFANVPYFPVAFIPIYASPSPQISAIIERLTAGDWSKAPDAVLFKARFVSRPYWPPVVRLLYSMLRKIPGLGWIGRMPDLVAAVARRFR